MGCRSAIRGLILSKLLYLGEILDLRFFILVVCYCLQGRNLRRHGERDFFHLVKEGIDTGGDFKLALEGPLTPSLLNLDLALDAAQARLARELVVRALLNKNFLRVLA